jgi:23S rRNA pseudouridine1911/1915/1917 synthase
MGAEKSILITLPATAAGQRLDKALAEAVPLYSRERLKNLVQGGRLSGLAGVIWDPATKMKGGEALTLDVPEARPSDTVAQDIPLTIVHEDDHLLVVDKPAGLVVHPAAGNYDGTMVNALLHHCAGRLSGIGGVARPGIVHRIDKDTSGLLVVAKTDKAHEGLAAQFARHDVDRRYTAVVAGVPVPPAGRIEGALARSTTNRQKMAIVKDGRGKHAITHFRTVAAFDGADGVRQRLLALEVREYTFTPEWQAARGVGGDAAWPLPPPLPRPSATGRGRSCHPRSTRTASFPRTSR